VARGPTPGSRLAGGKGGNSAGDGRHRRIRHASPRRDDEISVNGRPVADKARRNPEAREEVGRGVNGRGHDLGSVLVQRSVHLAAPGIDPRRNRRGVAAGLPIRSPRERVERRDADEWLALREREPLHRRDADAQPGKRSGAGGDRVEVDLRELEAVSIEEYHQLRGQPLGLRTCRVAGLHVNDLRSAHQRGATRPRRRVERQDHHEG